MAERTHYDVLGVAPDASDIAIRDAFRRRARESHPDQHHRHQSSAVGGQTMPAINEAYHVLKDPGRRAIYDRSLGRSTHPTGDARSAAAGSAAARSREAGATDGAAAGWDASQLARHHGPVRVPWRSMLLAAVVGTVGVVALAQFTRDGGDIGPDGILRNGDCVELQPNNDAREISCAGEGDLVVRAFVPFDGTCPGDTAAHRDRQGMGVACIAVRR